MTSDEEAAWLRLFEPLTLARFVSERWPSRLCFDEQRPERCAALDQLLCGAELGRLFAAHEAVAPAAIYLPEGLGMSAQSVPALQARERIAGGNVVLKQMHRALPSLGGCVQRLERACGLAAGSCDSHIHVSGSGQGFVPHFDSKDVLVFQVSGTKTWWVSEAPFIEAPADDYDPGRPVSPALLPRWPAAVPSDGTFTPADRELRPCVMAPGSMLYLPRGHWHRTQALDVSVSLTFGFHTKR